MDIKTEGIGFVKQLGLVAASLGAVWGYTEPIVEDYIHDQIKIVQEEDKKLIKELEMTIDDDYKYNVEKRNEIIKEIKNINPNTDLNYEN